MRGVRRCEREWTNRPSRYLLKSASYERLCSWLQTGLCPTSVGSVTVLTDCMPRRIDRRGEAGLVSMGNICVNRLHA